MLKVAIFIQADPHRSEGIRMDQIGALVRQNLEAAPPENRLDRIDILGLFRSDSIGTALYLFVWSHFATQTGVHPPHARIGANIALGSFDSSAFEEVPANAASAGLGEDFAGSA
jgi:hypothetical protein